MDRVQASDAAREDLSSGLSYRTGNGQEDQAFQQPSGSRDESFIGPGNCSDQLDFGEFARDQRDFSLFQERPERGTLGFMQEELCQTRGIEVNRWVQRISRSARSSSRMRSMVSESNLWLSLSFGKTVSSFLEGSRTPGRARIRSKARFPGPSAPAREPRRASSLTRAASLFPGSSSRAF